MAITLTGTSSGAQGLFNRLMVRLAGWRQPGPVGQAPQQSDVIHQQVIMAALVLSHPG